MLNEQGESSVSPRLQVHCACLAKLVECRPETGRSLCSARMVPGAATHSEANPRCDQIKVSSGKPRLLMIG